MAVFGVWDVLLSFCGLGSCLSSGLGSFVFSVFSDFLNCIKFSILLVVYHFFLVYDVDFLFSCLVLVVVYLLLC